MAAAALLALLLCATDGGTLKPADAGATLGPNPRATVLFGGDVIPHTPLKDAIRTAARRDPEAMANLWAEAIAPLKPAFSAADFSLVNLETPIVTSKKPFTGQWIFTATPDLLEGLKRAGVKAVSFANNHARDQQLEGITATRKYLEAAGLKAVGAASDEKTAWEPLVVELNGIRIGFFAFTRFLNHFQNKGPKKPHVPFVPYAGEKRDGGTTVDELLKRIKEMRANVDALVVLPHWGNEYWVSPKDSDQALAELLLTAGVTAVVGTHPHVVQPVLWRRMGPGDDRLVAFSVGNLISNQEPDKWTDEARFGLLLELTFERVSGGAVKVVAAKPTPIWTNNLAAPNGRKISVMTLKDAIEMNRKIASEATSPGKQKMYSRRADIMERKGVWMDKQTRGEVSAR